MSDLGNAVSFERNRSTGNERNQNTGNERSQNIGNESSVSLKRPRDNVCSERSNKRRMIADEINGSVSQLPHKNNYDNLNLDLNKIKSYLSNALKDINLLKSTVVAFIEVNKNNRSGKEMIIEKCSEEREDTGADNNERTYNENLTDQKQISDLPIIIGSEIIGSKKFPYFEKKSKEKDENVGAKDKKSKEKDENIVGAKDKTIKEKNENIVGAKDKKSKEKDENIVGAKDKKGKEKDENIVGAKDKKGKEKDENIVCVKSANPNKNLDQEKSAKSTQQINVKSLNKIIYSPKNKVSNIGMGFELFGKWPASKKTSWSNDSTSDEKTSSDDDGIPFLPQRKLKAFILLPPGETCESVQKLMKESEVDKVEDIVVINHSNMSKAYVTFADEENHMKALALNKKLNIQGRQIQIKAHKEENLWHETKSNESDKNIVKK